MRGRVLGSRGGWRRLTASAGALAVTLAMVVWGARPASAGGPTSAFLASPETGETAGLYYSDREYTQLESLLQAGTLGAPPKGARADRRITVTWLIHDTSPWRIDWIFPVIDGDDVWVHRTMNITEPTKGSWHRAPNPERLRALLTDLGVLGEGDGGEELSAFSLREMYTITREDGAPAETEAPVQSERPAEGAPVEGAPAPRPAAASGAGEDTDWWWALPGGAAGAVLALTLRPFATRLPLGGRKGEPGPRQELLDV